MIKHLFKWKTSIQGDANKKKQNCKCKKMSETFFDSPITIQVLNLIIFTSPAQAIQHDIIHDLQAERLLINQNEEAKNNFKLLTRHFT